MALAWLSPGSGLSEAGASMRTRSGRTSVTCIAWHALQSGAGDEGAACAAWDCGAVLHCFVRLCVASCAQVRGARRLSFIFSKAT